VQAELEISLQAVSLRLISKTQNSEERRKEITAKLLRDGKCSTVEPLQLHLHVLLVDNAHKTVVFKELSQHQ
jgi:hypothetical protein